ncbi:ABC transporter permease [Pseudofrankia asymbiotica]
MTMDDIGPDTADTADTAGTRSHALVHARIMLRRNLRHMRRYPSLTLMIILMPLVFLLLFVYVFGGTLGSGLGSGLSSGLGSGTPADLRGGRAAYADYVAPAIILMAVAAAAQGTAIAVAQDMTEGVIARFRTMAVARSSVLTGHVVGATIQTLIGVVVVTAAALAVGFRPHANAAEWLAAFGVVLLLTFAVTWLCVGLGLSAKSVETASNSPMFLILLPFLGSGFVPTSSLPTGMRWFAEYEPFTPVNETLRGLLTGTEIGDNLVITIAWCVGVAALSYIWSRRLYEREPKPLAS